MTWGSDCRSMVVNPVANMPSRSHPATPIRFFPISKPNADGDRAGGLFDSLTPSNPLGPHAANFWESENGASAADV